MEDNDIAGNHLGSRSSSLFSAFFFLTSPTHRHVRLLLTVSCIWWKETSWKRSRGWGDEQQVVVKL